MELVDISKSELFPKSDDDEDTQMEISNEFEIREMGKLSLMALSIQKGIQRKNSSERRGNIEREKEEKAKETRLS